MQQNSDGDPVFNVEFQGETTLVSPQQIAEAVYEKMLGQYIYMYVCSKVTSFRKITCVYVQ